MKKCDRDLENVTQSCKLRAAFSSPRSHFFTVSVQTEPKPANNTVVFFPAVNWLSSGFVYTTLSLNQFTCCLQTIDKKICSVCSVRISLQCSS